MKKIQSVLHKVFVKHKLDKHKLQSFLVDQLFSYYSVGPMASRNYIPQIMYSN